MNGYSQSSNIYNPTNGGEAAPSETGANLGGFNWDAKFISAVAIMATMMFMKK
jgi:hypothetical protein